MKRSRRAGTAWKPLICRAGALTEARLRSILEAMLQEGMVSHARGSWHSVKNGAACPGWAISR